MPITAVMMPMTTKVASQDVSGWAMPIAAVMTPATLS